MIEYPPLTADLSSNVTDLAYALANGVGVTASKAVFRDTAGGCLWNLCDVMGTVGLTEVGGLPKSICAVKERGSLDPALALTIFGAVRGVG